MGYFNGVTPLPPVIILSPTYVKLCDVHELTLNLTHDKDRGIQIPNVKSRGQYLNLDLTNDKHRPNTLIRVINITPDS